MLELQRSIPQREFEFRWTVQPKDKERQAFEIKREVLVALQDEFDNCSVSYTWKGYVEDDSPVVFSITFTASDGWYKATDEEVKQTLEGILSRINQD